MSILYQPIVDQCDVEVCVEFKSKRYLENIALNIRDIDHPNVILWYIGYRGLRKGSVDFYRSNVIQPFLENNPFTTFWLMDLTAWFAFVSPKGSIKKHSCFSEVISDFKNEKIKSIRSSDIFEEMAKLSDPYIITNMTSLINKKFIKNASECHLESGIKVKDIFHEGCLIMKDWYNKDAARAYSAFQYLEGCLIVEKILNRKICAAEPCSYQEINLSFVLPNDEIKYYLDCEGSFQKDLQLIISRSSSILGLHRLKLNVCFFPFPYGAETRHRPYNAPSKRVNKKLFNLNEVIGKEKNVLNSIY